MKTNCHLSRFGNLDVEVSIDEDGLDEVEDDDRGAKPVKPKPSPATFFLLFFLWFNFRCTSRFLTCVYIYIRLVYPYD